ncbi:MAG TPA: tryptophan synthase subunit alpha [Candidatus Hydrogenedentes bacterium]|nr:tryptophan synthase subunit alpha [Candidatus Hydrogenedentota bacterium]HPU98032.1 tryptophan synthase subunit alpha [Candidatus Hydrogenedentota bacterium]
MNRIEERLALLKQAGKTAFIPFLMAGDPDFASSEEIVFLLDRSGADIIEYGVPFSDPVGDGPVIQQAAQRALRGGASMKEVLESVRRIRTRSSVPLMLFSYLNPILAYGIEAFARDAAEAGVDGVLCVDLPPDEAAEYKRLLDAAGICTIFLAAPTTTEVRLKLIGEQSSGFVYYISRLGVTGERAILEKDLERAVTRVKKLTGKPVCVGFGISTPEQAAAVASMADGVVIGSALVRLIHEQSARPGGIDAIKVWADNMSRAIHEKH